MSYIKKIEKDYNDSLISLSKLSQLREKYLALSEEEKKELDYNSLSEEEKRNLKLNLQKEQHLPLQQLMIIL